MGGRLFTGLGEWLLSLLSFSVSLSMMEVAGDPSVFFLYNNLCETKIVYTKEYK